MTKTEACINWIKDYFKKEKTKWFMELLKVQEEISGKKFN